MIDCRTLISQRKIGGLWREFRQTTWWCDMDKLPVVGTLIKDTVVYCWSCTAANPADIDAGSLNLLQVPLRVVFTDTTEDAYSYTPQARTDGGIERIASWGICNASCQGQDGVIQRNITSNHEIKISGTVAH